jgi:two-component system cell cycle sensor histidine kinase/response regulator CckA
VTDTGSGIASAHVDRIFEPFFTTKAESAGTGLGLSVVHGIVRQHRGFITVVSELERGTRFDVYLPAITGEATSPPPKPAASSRGGQERILVVDDEELVLKVNLTVLSRAGYRVEAAADAARALEILREQAETIDLVVTDLMMPRMNGRQLMERCREQGFDVPFLFVSGYSDGGIHRDFVLEKGISLLKKPYHPNELASAVREVLDRTEPPRSA